MEAQAEAPSSSNIASNEIDEETSHKLRGDAIGNTMYSEKFVANTLLKFYDLKWSKELEDDLCFLWDMTEEKDVCKYLFQISYPELACSAIIDYNEPRFIEIVVGILANILCAKCDGPSIKEEETKTVLNLLESDDPYILTQVMRFIEAISFIYDSLPFITSEHMEKFSFILCNSTNKELLVHTLKALSLITSDSKVKETVLKGELLMSAITGYRLIKENADCESSFEMFGSQEQHTVVKHIVELLCNICCYIDTIVLTELADELNSHFGDFAEEIASLLNYYSVENNLLPVDESFKFHMEALNYICLTLRASYESSLVVPLCKILLIFMKRNIESVEICTDLLCYFISVADINTLKRDFAKLPLAEMKNMLLHVKNFNTFDYYPLTNLTAVMNEL